VYIRVTKLIVQKAFSSSDAQFATAVSYALHNIGKAGIVLKPERLQPLGQGKCTMFFMDRNTEYVAHVQTVALYSGYKATVWPCYNTKSVHEDPTSSSENAPPQRNQMYDIFR